VKISELINDIRTRDAVLPEFQREYVWSKEQAKQLLVSLTREFPVGGLLFWKTDQPPELKNIDELPDKLGAMQVILDGQQRLTTLCMLITGEVPPYYRESEINNDPRDLYYNLDTREFEYYSSRMRGNPLWLRVVDCFDRDVEVDVFEIAKRVAGDHDAEAFRLANRYLRHLERLRHIQDMDLPVQMVPVHASVDDAIDVFDRVNSQGTKLTEAELALTHVTGKWSQARRVMKCKIDELSAVGFDFDLTFMTRALTGTVTHRALFESIHDRSQDELVSGWKTLSKLLDYLVNILRANAHIDSTQDLNTTNVLIPVIVYLTVNGGQFPGEKSIKNAIHWLYAAHIWARYTGQTNQRLEQDVSIVMRSSSPWDALREQIVDQRGRIEVKPADLQARGASHPLYRMLAILTKANGAVDWFNGVPLASTHGKAYSIHGHHIFPSSLLYSNGYSSENHLHRKLVNEIANRAFLTADTNYSLAAARPEEYLPQVEERFPGALVKQFVPMDPDLWRVERYEDFLAARRDLVASKLNSFMACLITEPEVVHERPVAELIELGESATLEFKSTLQWDMVRKQANKGLRLSVLKTVAAFLNSAGGTLVIGVEDDGNVCGLDNDLKILHRSLDKFEQLLTSLISERIGGHVAALVHIRFETVADKTVCTVDVERAPDPVFVSDGADTKFYIRFGNTTHQLNVEEATQYIQDNWE